MRRLQQWHGIHRRVQPTLYSSLVSLKSLYTLQVLASPLLETDVHTWTLQMSTHGHRQKWTLPRSMTRFTRGHRTKSPVWTQKKYIKKNQWHWKDLNPGLLYGSAVHNQLHHGGQFELQKVCCSIYWQFLRNQKNGPCAPGSTRGLFWRHQKRSLWGPPHMDLLWRSPRSDLSNCGHYGKVHAKTSQGPFFIPEKWTFLFSSRASSIQGARGHEEQIHSCNLVSALVRVTLHLIWLIT
jgi:hypothetical protein